MDLVGAAGFESSSKSITSSAAVAKVTVDGAAALALGDGGRFMNAVALRTAPPRSSKKPKDNAHAEPSQKSTVTEQASKHSEDGQQARSALERLMDKFK